MKKKGEISKEIVAKSLPKNGSDDHNLLWSSDGIFGAAVYFHYTYF